MSRSVKPPSGAESASATGAATGTPVEVKKADAKRDKSDKTARVEKKFEKADEVRKTEKKPDKVVEKKQDKVEKTVEKTPEPVKAVAQVGPPGTITIDSAPVYAVIYIDGKKYGETPVVNIKLAAGKHSVRAVSPSGSTQNLTINIESGKSSVRRIGW